MYYIGIDVGGTKMAVILSTTQFEIVDKVVFATKETITPDKTIARYFSIIDSMIATHGLASTDIKSIGISCGGPLSSKRGVVLSPPNLPGWDNVEIVRIFEEKYGITTRIQNDANACALAEWKLGAGKGTKDMIFLTFGTGMGAGLIINGALFAGQNDCAGEVGHMRLAPTGPVGFNKAGSFEGFCSGGGIVNLGAIMLEEAKKNGYNGKLIEDYKGGEISTKLIFQRAKEGEALANEIVNECARKLGAGLSILVDLLNPEKIVIGSIFTRDGDMLIPEMSRVMKEECIDISLANCQVVPATLGESIGDLASLIVATGEY